MLINGKFEINGVVYYYGKHSGSPTGFAAWPEGDAYEGWFEAHSLDAAARLARHLARENAVMHRAEGGAS